VIGRNRGESQVLVGRKQRSAVDYLTLLGLMMSVGAIVAGNMLEGGKIGGLLQLTAFVVVVGGTMGAVLLQTPLADFVQAMRRLVRVVVPLHIDRQAMIEQIVDWSRIARLHGLLALEDAADSEQDDFARRGIRLLIDGFEPEEIRATLEVHNDSRLAAEARYAQVFDAMGGYCPTVGILGAVLGLIQVMRNLSDPSALGSGIAVAFVATIYGVGLANLLFLPVASKLRAIYMDQVQYRDMIVAGLAMIADGDNPQAIRRKLEGYLS